MNAKQMHTPTAKSGGRILRNDLLFVLALLIVISVLGLCLFLSGGNADTVVVTVDGEPYASYPLDKDIAVNIRTGPDESGLNVLVIRDGTAYVESASCPDKICAEHKPIRRSGESIICLPNKVVISVRSESGRHPDIIS